MLWETPGDLLNGELGGREDRSHALAIALILVPIEGQFARLLSCGDIGVGVLGQSEPRRLENCRNRGANDVGAMVGKVGVPARCQPAAPIAVVPVEGDLEHAGVRASTAA